MPKRTATPTYVRRCFRPPQTSRGSGSALSLSRALISSTREAEINSSLQFLSSSGFLVGQSSRRMSTQQETNGITGATRHSSLDAVEQGETSEDRRFSANVRIGVSVGAADDGEGLSRGPLAREESANVVFGATGDIKLDESSLVHVEQKEEMNDRDDVILGGSSREQIHSEVTISEVTKATKVPLDEDAQTSPVHLLTLSQSSSPSSSPSSPTEEGHGRTQHKKARSEQLILPGLPQGSAEVAMTSSNGLGLKLNSPSTEIVGTPFAIDAPRFEYPFPQAYSSPQSPASPAPSSATSKSTASPWSTAASSPMSPPFLGGLLHHSPSYHHHHHHHSVSPPPSAIPLSKGDVPPCCVAAGGGAFPVGPAYSPVHPKLRSSSPPVPPALAKKAKRWSLGLLLPRRLSSDSSVKSKLSALTPGDENGAEELEEEQRGRRGASGSF